MYNFKDTIQRVKPEKDIFIPTSAMAYDYVLLEEYISGYQTLSVEGREMYSLNLETQEKQIGSSVTNVKYPSRILTIKYKLEDKDPIELQRKFDDLLSFLIRDEEVKIYFNDDPEYFFLGMYQSSDSVSGDVNSIISSFTVFCSDPFKYGREKNANGVIVEELPYLVKPDVFKFEMLKDKLIASDTKYNLKVSSAKKSDVIIFDFKTGDLLVNGEKRNELIDLDSDFKNVRLKKGSDFRSGNYELEITYRKAVL